MGPVQKPILRVVTVLLSLCAVLGFGLGISQTIPHRVVEEEAPIAANLPANAVIKDAQAFTPPPPPPPVKAAKAEVADSDEAASDVAADAAAPALKAPPAPPAEAAPGAPPGQAQAPAPPPPDLPPT